MRRGWIEDISTLKSERFAYLLMRDIRPPAPVVGETITLYDDAGEEEVQATITLISGANVVELKVNHNSWIGRG